MGRTPGGYHQHGAPDTTLAGIISSLGPKWKGRKVELRFAVSDMTDLDNLIARPENLTGLSDRVFGWFGTQSQKVVCLSCF